MIPSQQTCTVGSMEGPSIQDEEVDAYVVLLKALSHPVRLRMVDLIRQNGGDVCVCEFEQHFELTQPTISHHLKILRDASIIRSRQEGTWVHHSIEMSSFNRVRQLTESFTCVEDLV